MNKLYSEFIDKMIEKKCSSREIDFILYIARFQDNFGTVHSVYYKEVCANAGMSTQKFYDVVESLTKKGLITTRKRTVMGRPAKDLTVTLIGNAQPAGDYAKNGYIKSTKMDYLGTEFRGQKAGSKLIFLYMQRFTKGKRMLVSNFYADFCMRFKTSRKSLQLYIRELIESGLLYAVKKRNGSYHYEIALKCSEKLSIKDYLIKNEKEEYRENVGRHIEREYRKYIPAGADEARAKEPISPGTTADRSFLSQNEIITQLTALLTRTSALWLPGSVDALLRAVESSLALKQSEGAKKAVINPALVNKFFTEAVKAA